MHRIDFLKRKRKKIYSRFYIFVLFFLLIILLGVVYFFPTRKINKDIENFLPEQIADQNNVITELNTTYDSMRLLYLLSGMGRPMTYLALLQNNTELRPTGGFIGSFAVVTLSKGRVDVLWLDDSYNLDRFSQGYIKELPPTPITDYLGVKYWYFRDSNWNPDFEVSAQKALSLYNEESHYYQGEKTVPLVSIDGVLAITPTVIERLLSLTGGITAKGKEYTSENFVSDLEYRVEYEFSDYGESKHEIKDIIAVIANALLDKMKHLGVVEKFHAIKILRESLADKQILLYAQDVNLQKSIVKNNFGGKVISVPEGNDYIYIVDANMGSLKTDLSVDRSASYSLNDVGDTVMAELKLNYKHVGNYDWRTSYYGSYTHVYLPKNSEIVSIVNITPTENIKLTEKDWDRYDEFGYLGIGFYFSVLPQSEESIVIQYKVAKSVVESIKRNKYQLFIQKQPGTLQRFFHLDFNAFGMVNSQDMNLVADKQVVLTFPQK